MFDTYDFQLGDCYYYSVYDVTIAEMNRPHTHGHVEDGLSNYTSNWELVEVDDGLRRGSAQLYLVDDAYYVSCSRTGLERSGNSIRCSKNSPESLVMSVVKSIFEGVLERNSIDISTGIDKDEFFDGNGGVKIATPKQFVLANECTQDEINNYYDELADHLYSLISEYQECKSVSGIEEAVDKYKDTRKSLYREYTNFQPTILSQVLPNMEGENGWVLEDDIDGATSHHLVYNEENGHNDQIFYIEIVDDSKVQVLDYVEDYVFESYEYDTEEQLRDRLNDLMEYSVSDLVSN